MCLHCVRKCVLCCAATSNIQVKVIFQLSSLHVYGNISYNDPATTIIHFYLGESLSLSCSHCTFSTLTLSHFLANIVVIEQICSVHLSPKKKSATLEYSCTTLLVDVYWYWTNHITGHSNEEISFQHVNI